MWRLPIFLALLVALPAKAETLTYSPLDTDNFSAANVTVTGALAVTGLGADFSAATDALKLQTGTTAQRPTGVAGKLRYNSTTGLFEGYVGGAWNAFATEGGELSYKSGRWYTVPGSVTTKSYAATSHGLITAFPYRVRATTTVNKLGTYVTTGGVGSYASFGLYSTSATGYGGSLLGYTATAATTASANSLEVSLATPTTVYPGVYWLALCQDYSTSGPTLSIPSTTSWVSTMTGTASAGSAIAGGTASLSGFISTTTANCGSLPSSLSAATVQSAAEALVAFSPQ